MAESGEQTIVTSTTSRSTAGQPERSRAEVSAYYVVAEALTNSAKHSRASTVTVTVNKKPAERILYLEVADDGIRGADFSGGTGLLGLKDE